MGQGGDQLKNERVAKLPISFALMLQSTVGCFSHFYFENLIPFVLFMTQGGYIIPIAQFICKLSLINGTYSQISGKKVLSGLAGVDIREEIGILRLRKYIY